MEKNMIKMTIAFFAIGIGAFALSSWHMAGLTIESGKTLLVTFMSLAALTFFVTLT